MTAAIIFDFDGTLVDSMGLWHQIDIDYLKRRGIKCPNELPLEISGKSMKETAQYFKTRFNLPDSLEEIQNEWDLMSHFEMLKTIDFKPGALDFLAWVHQKKLPMSIASSNSRKNLNVFLPHHQIEHYFHSLHFTGEVGKGKPAPDVFLAASQSMGVDSKNCLVFEDTLEGIQGAIAAGMQVISVEDFYQSAQIETIKNLSLRHINDFRELMNDDFLKDLEVYL